MEEVEFNFDFEDIIVKEIKYVVKFDTTTGKVISFGPRSVDENNFDEIEVDADMAEDIKDGRINLHNCFVDFYDNKLEIKENKFLFKLDDVLHRIIEKKFSKIEESDIFVTCYTKKNKLRIELTDRFHGTKKNCKDPKKKQRISWNDDTVMDFYVTAYNDPHHVIESFSIKIEDLVGMKFEKSIAFPDKFSVFTRRLLKKYTLEIK